MYKDLAGKSFNSYAVLKAEYDNLVEKYSESNTSSSGVGGGGGGGGGNNNAANSEPPLKPTNPMPSGVSTPITKKHFNDMDNALWAQEACEYLAEKEVISGKGEGVFAPMDNVTREEFVAIIVRGFGFEKYVDNTEFKDLSENDWCYDYVLSAAQNGIIQGIGDGYFGKGHKITRQDMATILYRVISKKELNLAKVRDDFSFKDADSIPDYAKEAVSYLTTRGIVSGMEDGSFSGRESASRAQAAQMIYNVLKSMEGRE